MSGLNLNKLIYETRQDNKVLFSREPGRFTDYSEVLDYIKNIISRNHSRELALIIENKDAETALKNLIGTYLREKAFMVKDAPEYEDLVDRLYDDMAGFAFLSKYIYDDNVEEINGNSWNDIEIVTTGGWRKLDEHFVSPDQSIDIAKKMAKLGGVIVDGSCPAADSYITKGVRVSVLIPPVVEEENGAAFSIRKQRIGNFSKDDLIHLETATADELDFLILCIRHGISVAIAGATGSGKTTDIGFLINNIPDELRVFSIEDSRELSLHKYDDTGKIVNRVIQTKIRPSDTPRSNISGDVLLKRSLRFHPDIIIPAEMRGEEAQTAQEAGRTGHTIITSLHATTALAAYTRILTMCMTSGTKLSEDIMMRLIIEAFPIMVFKKQLADKSRKYMKIIEAEDFKNGKVLGRTLFRYAVTGRELSEDGKSILKINGYHQRMSPISFNIANRLLENGADIDVIRKYAPEEWEPGSPEGEDHINF